MNDHHHARDAAEPDAPLIELARLDAALRRIGAQLSASDVQALYMGALSSTNVNVGPNDFLDTILGDEPDLGQGQGEVYENLQLIFGFWNQLHEECQSGRFRLPVVALSDPPSAAELGALAERRSRDVALFLYGFDAAGGDVEEVGEKQEYLLTTIEEGGEFAAGYDELLEAEGAIPTAVRIDTADALVKLGEVLEDAMLRLWSLGEQRRVDAILADLERRAPITRNRKMGRNEPCPCGSGRKWKRCCGARAAEEPRP